MDANKYRTAYDKAQAVQHEVWTELCQHLEHAPDAQLLSDYTATLVYTLDKDRREEALRLLRGQSAIIKMLLYLSRPDSRACVSSSSVFFHVSTTSL